VDFVITEDSDLLPFGCPKVRRVYCFFFVNYSKHSNSISNDVYKFFTKAGISIEAIYYLHLSRLLCHATSQMYLLMQVLFTAPSGILTPNSVIQLPNTNCIEIPAKEYLFFITFHILALIATKILTTVHSGSTYNY
jgi:hypothetical protein